jgi:hypothetical protein
MKKNTSVRVGKETHTKILELKCELEKQAKCMIPMDKVISYAVQVAKKRIKEDKEQLALVLD